MDKINSVKGVKDYLPDQANPRNMLIRKIQKISHNYGFEHIETPILEHLELFKRAVGHETDVVGKEMYQFQDINNDVLCLRPEATASVVRAGISSGWLAQNPQTKLMYCGPMFRRERPQKGRYRQFTQIGLEMFGYPSYLAEVELIAICDHLWNKLGIRSNVELEINNIGSTNDRQKYKEALVAFFMAHQQVLTPEQITRLQTNPLRILDSKDDNIQELIAQAPSIANYLSSESQEEFSQLLTLLTNLNITYTVNHKLVRGLDYYNNCVWEWTTTLLGSQNTICAGGRYDNLVEQLGGKPVTAVGFSLGLERVLEMVKEPTIVCPDIIAFGFSEDANNFLYQKLANIRHALPNISIHHHLNSGKPKNLFKIANKSGAKLAIFAGDNEIETDQLTYKHLRQENQQSSLHVAELIEIIPSLI